MPLTFEEVPVPPPAAPTSTPLGGAAGSGSARQPYRRLDGNPPKNRVTVTLTETGAIDFDSLRGDSRAKLLEAIKSSKLPESDATPAFDRSDVEGLYAIAGRVEAMIARMSMRIDADIASAVFVYGKEELDLLEGPTLKMLERYSPAFFTKYKDVIAFLGLNAALTQAKFKLAQEKQAERKAAGPQLQPQRKANAVTVDNSHEEKARATA